MEREKDSSHWTKSLEDPLNYLNHLRVKQPTSRKRSMDQDWLHSNYSICKVIPWKTSCWNKNWNWIHFWDRWLSHKLFLEDFLKFLHKTLKNYLHNSFDSIFSEVFTSKNSSEFGHSYQMNKANKYAHLFPKQSPWCKGLLLTL